MMRAIDALLRTVSTTGGYKRTYHYRRRRRGAGKRQRGETIDRERWKGIMLSKTEG
jgi:hypothetical protein